MRDQCEEAELFVYWIFISLYQEAHNLKVFFLFLLAYCLCIESQNASLCR